MNLEEIIERKINESKSVGELSDILKNLITYNSVDENEKLYSIRALVDSIHGMKIEIYSNEHAPPHFHVKGQNLNAVFSLEECELLKGDIGSREQKMIEWWHKRSKKILINFWNDTRPGDGNAPEKK
jgi:hypothetical protein